MVPDVRSNLRENADGFAIALFQRYGDRRPAAGANPNCQFPNTLPAELFSRWSTTWNSSGSRSGNRVRLVSFRLAVALRFARPRRASTVTASCGSRRFFRNDGNRLRQLSALLPVVDLALSTEDYLVMPQITVPTLASTHHRSPVDNYVIGMAFYNPTLKC